jgi:enolase
MVAIKNIRAMVTLDSRGNPMVRVRVEPDGGRSGTAAVPSGASTGKHELVGLRDGHGWGPDELGVLMAVCGVGR